MRCAQGWRAGADAHQARGWHERDKDVQRRIESASDTLEPGGPGFAEALASLGTVKPTKCGAEPSAMHSAAGGSTSEFVLPAPTPTQRRRRVAFKVAAVLSVLLHGGSLLAFLAWHGSTDTGALERPSDAISVEIVASRTLEAMLPKQILEPAASPAATAPVEGKTEAADAQPVQPQPKEAPEPAIVVPPLPIVIPDATEEVMRTVKQERLTKSDAPSLPVEGPAEVVPPPPESGVSEDNAPAKRKEQANKKKAVERAPKGGVTSKASAGKGIGGERASASSGSILSYAAHVRARVAGNKPSGGGLRGTAVVSFGVTTSGGLAYASVARSSGSSQLDQLAVSAVRGAAPFPSPPAGATSAQLRFSIPFHFQ